MAAAGAHISDRLALLGFLSLLAWVGARASPAALVQATGLSLAPGDPRGGRGRRLGYRIKPFLHAAGWIVAVRGGIDLENSQANTDRCPVRFPPARNPFRIIAGSIGRMEAVPPCVDPRFQPVYLSEPTGLVEVWRPRHRTAES